MEGVVRLRVRLPPFGGALSYLLCCLAERNNATIGTLFGDVVTRNR
jgi:hypothetical protein